MNSSAGISTSAGGKTTSTTTVVSTKKPIPVKQSLPDAAKDEAASTTTTTSSKKVVAPSPTKSPRTRLVRVYRNSQGEELSRMYVDNTNNGDTTTTEDAVSATPGAQQLPPPAPPTRTVSSTGPIKRRVIKVKRRASCGGEPIELAVERAAAAAAAADLDDASVASGQPTTTAKAMPISALSPRGGSGATTTAQKKSFGSRSGSSSVSASPKPSRQQEFFGIKPTTTTGAHQPPPRVPTSKATSSSGVGRVGTTAAGRGSASAAGSSTGSSSSSSSSTTASVVDETPSVTTTTRQLPPVPSLSTTTSTSNGSKKKTTVSSPLGNGSNHSSTGSSSKSRIQVGGGNKEPPIDAAVVDRVKGGSTSNNNVVVKTIAASLDGSQRSTKTASTTTTNTTPPPTRPVTATTNASKTPPKKELGAASSSVNVASSASTSRTNPALPPKNGGSSNTSNAVASSVPSTTKASTTTAAASSESEVQALRMLRVVLGEPTAAVTLETVDRVLQKHADSLRMQVQHKQQLRDQRAELETQRTEIAKLTKQNTKHETEIAKQKEVMRTALEIKDVELNIMSKERDQTTIKLQQMKWRLAKERTAMKDKAAAAAAAMAATASLTDRAVNAEHELSAKEEAIQALEKMVENTVSALRGKDMFLKQLLQQRTCVMCQPIVTHDNAGPEPPPACGTCGKDNGGIDLGDDDDDEEVEGETMAQGTKCLVELQPDLLEQPLPKRSAMSVNSSDATPVMGQSASSGMVLHDLIRASTNNAVKTPSVQRSMDSSSHHGDIDTRSITSSKVKELEADLYKTKQLLREAREMISTLEEAKLDLEADMEETQYEIKRKNTQLKKVLIVCDERRRAAEDRLRELGQFDEGRSILPPSTTKPEEETIVQGIVDRETIGLPRRASSSSGSVSSVGTNELVRNHQELEKLKERLAETINEVSRLGCDLELQTTQLNATLASNIELNTQVTTLQEQIVNAEHKIDALNAERSALADELHEMQRITDTVRVELEETQRCLQSAETRLKEYTVELEETQNALQQSETNAGEYVAELAEARMQLQRSEAKHGDYQIQLNEANTILQESQIVMGTLTAQIEREKTARVAAETKVQQYLSEVAEKKAAMQQAMCRMDDYSARLEHAKQTQQISESRADAYLAELHDVKDAMKQSESTIDECCAHLSNNSTTSPVSTSSDTLPETVKTTGSGGGADDETSTFVEFVVNVPQTDSDVVATTEKSILPVVMNDNDTAVDANRHKEATGSTKSEGLVPAAAQDTLREISAPDDALSPDVVVVEEGTELEQEREHVMQQLDMCRANIEVALSSSQQHSPDGSPKVAVVAALEAALQDLQHIRNEIVRLEQELVQSQSNLQDAKEKLMYFRNMVLTVVPSEGEQ